MNDVCINCPYYVRYADSRKCRVIERCALGVSLHKENCPRREGGTGDDELSELRRSTKPSQR